MTALDDLLSRISTATLRNHRGARYRAVEQAMTLARFPGELREGILSLYVALRKLAARLDGTGQERHVALDEIVAHIAAFSAESRRVTSLALLDDEVARAVHDIRGGALSALSIELETLLAEQGMVTRGTEEARRVAILVHDHLKILRNLVADIDDEQRRADLAFNPHALSTLARAIEASLAAMDGERSFDLGQDLFVADSCVEFTALERCTYNLTNNAMAHAPSSPIDVSLAIVGEHLRFAVANVVEADTARLLASRLARDPAFLFGDYSTTQSGRGLRIVADLVGRAYGIAEVDNLVSAGYIGTASERDHFLAWIHWPTLAPP